MDNNVLLNFINAYLVPFVIRLLCAVVVLVIGFLLAKWIVKLMKKSKVIEKLDPNMQLLLTNAVSIAIKVLAVVTAVIICGVPEATVIAVLGSCGLAIGLALQGGLSNIASGIVIMFCKPFRVGDFIMAGDISGVVEDIGLYYTKVLTPDNQNMTVPNSTMANATVTNLSTQENRRVDFDFSIDYASDIDLTRKVLLATAAMNDLVLKDPAPEVFVVAHDASAVKVRLRIWCGSADYWSVYFDMWEDVKRAFDKFGIVIPYNHLNVTIENQ